MDKKQEEKLTNFFPIPLCGTRKQQKKVWSEKESLIFLFFRSGSERIEMLFFLVCQIYERKLRHRIGIGWVAMRINATNKHNLFESN